MTSPRAPERTQRLASTIAWSIAWLWSTQTSRPAFSARAKRSLASAAVIAIGFSTKT